MKTSKLFVVIGFVVFAPIFCPFGLQAATEKGDIDAIDGVDLKDAIISLRIAANLKPAVAAAIADADANGDGRIGLEETAYVLQVIAGLRDSKGDCLNAEEQNLANLINAYRNTNGLPSIPISKSLTAVGQWHVWDLQTNNPITATCNLHSWSVSKPNLWTGMCYTADHAQAQKMWDKPAEITHNVYTAYGYEISASSSGITASVAFDMWKGSSAHSQVILEQGGWTGRNWPAMGVGIYGNYAVIWFGDMTDPLGTITQCP